MELYLKRYHRYQKKIQGFDRIRQLINKQKQQTVADIIDFDSDIDSNNDVVSSADLDELVNDSEMRSIWSRYHLVNDLIKGEVPKSIDLQLDKRIFNLIQQEPTLLVPNVRRQQREQGKDGQLKPAKVASIATSIRDWTEQATGLAIAASVTAIIVFGVQTLNTPTQQTSAITSLELLELDNLPIAEQSEHTQLQENLLDFTKQSSRYGLQNISPFVNVVSHSVTVPLTLFKPNYNLNPQLQKQTDDGNKPTQEDDKATR